MQSYEERLQQLSLAKGQATGLVSFLVSANSNI